VQPAYLADSLAVYLAVLQLLEENRTYVNRNPKCEPQLGRRGLYQAIGGTTHPAAAELALLWVLNLADGTRSLLEVADRAGLSFSDIREAADLLVEHDLLKECGNPVHPA
jgi:aminopeptidase-like protein